MFISNETINALINIFTKHNKERICVIGTMCCGKTTLVQKLSPYNCVDADDELWYKVPKEEMDALSQRPITKEIMDAVFTLMRERVTAKPGHPLFGITILDCEVVVYLDISHLLLKKHCEARGDTDYIDALYVKKYIEEDYIAHKVKSEKIFYRLTLTE